MQPKIVSIDKKLMIGQKMMMSFSEHNPYLLFRSFMPHRKEIINAVNNDIYSIENYPDNFFENFDINNEFEKWAAVEVSGLEYIPAGMESLVIPAGLYAVFIHIGEQQEAKKTYNYIFGEWLPNSGYKPDARPHFAVMGERYKKGSPLSEEDIFIPIRQK